MKIIRDYEKYMDDSNDFRKTTKKSFRKMRKEELYEVERSGRKKSDRKSK